MIVMVVIINITALIVATIQHDRKSLSPIFCVAVMRECYKLKTPR